MPMLTGTLITAAGFLPIGMAKSTVGEYTFAIFAVTAAALVISWVVSVYFVPYLGAWLLRTKAVHAEGGEHELFDTPFYNRFRAAVNWCVGTAGGPSASRCWCSRWAWRAWAGCSSSSSPIPAGRRSWWTCGCPRARPSRTASAWPALRAAHAAGAGPGVRGRLGGPGVPRFYLPLDQIFPQTNVSQFILLSKDLAAREALRKRLPELLATEFPEVRGASSCCPTGRRCLSGAVPRAGDDTQAVRHWADEVKALMRANARMRGVNDNWNEPVQAVRLSVDQDKARALGVTSQSIAQATQTLFSGRTIGQYREKDKLIDIVLRQPPEERTASASSTAPTWPPAAAGPFRSARSPTGSRAGSRACCGAMPASTPSPCRAM
jgi:multidrug efflux pump subunit AcrB